MGSSSSALRRSTSRVSTERLSSQSRPARCSCIRTNMRCSGGTTLASRHRRTSRAHKKSCHWPSSHLRRGCGFSTNWVCSCLRFLHVACRICDHCFIVVCTHFHLSMPTTCQHTAGVLSKSQKIFMVAELGKAQASRHVSGFLVGCTAAYVQGAQA